MKAQREAWVDDSIIQCHPRNHEDLNPIPRTHKKPGVDAPMIPNAGELEISSGTCWLASLICLTDF